MRKNKVTLRRCSPQNIIKIAQLDYWIRHTLDGTYKDAHFNEQYDKTLYAVIIDQQQSAGKRNHDDNEPFIPDYPLKRRKQDHEGTVPVFDHQGQRNLLYDGERRMDDERTNH